QTRIGDRVVLLDLRRRDGANQRLLPGNAVLAGGIKDWVAREIRGRLADVPHLEQAFLLVVQDRAEKRDPPVLPGTVGDHQRISWMLPSRVKRERNVFRGADQDLVDKELCLGSHVKWTAGMHAARQGRREQESDPESSHGQFLPKRRTIGTNENLWTYDS